MNDNSVKYAAVIASSSFYIGGNWGFLLNDGEEYSKSISILRQDTQNIKIQGVSNGAIVFCRTDILDNCIRMVDNQIDPQLNEKRKNLNNIEINEFRKFLTKIARGNSNYGFREKDYTEYVIGLYSCNNYHKIRLNGIEYPAFSLPINLALGEIKKLEKVLNVYVNTSDGFISSKQINSGGEVLRVREALEISKTLTGAFLTIRIY